MAKIIINSFLLLLSFISNGQGSKPLFRSQNYVTTVACGTDADAISFLSTAGITNSTICTAVDNLVIALKGYSLWTKMKAVYPFVGGTSSTHSYNLKNPATYQITWSGTVTHNSNGITGDGSSGYGNTGLQASTVMSNNDLALGFDSRTSGSQTAIDMSAYDGTLDHIIQLASCYSGSSYYDLCYNGGNGRISITSAGDGFYVSTRPAFNIQSGYRNGSLEVSSSGAQGTLPSGNFMILQSNGGAFSSRNLDFAFISDGLDGTQIANFYTALSAFKTALSR